VDRLTGGRRLIAAGAMTAGILLTAACGGGSGGSGDGAHTTAPAGGAGSPSATASPAAPAKPMATMPPGTDAGLAQKGRISVCGVGEPPFFQAPGTGDTTKEVGFDVDMLTLLGQRVGAEPVVTDYQGAKLQEALKGTPLADGACDIVAGIGADDPKNFPGMTFGIPFFTQDEAILAKKGTHYTSPAALKGKRVAGGPAAKQALGSAANTMQFTTVNSGDALLTGELLHGGADAVVMTNAEAMNVVAEHPEYGLEVGGEFGTRYYQRLAVKKGNTALLAQIDAALKDAGANGQYAKSYRRWFGQEPPSVPTGE
jgi:polar amino acid transport system substrate-binding protein